MAPTFQTEETKTSGASNIQTRPYLLSLRSTSKSNDGPANNWEWLPLKKKFSAKIVSRPPLLTCKKKNNNKTNDSIPDSKSCFKLSRSTESKAPANCIQSLAIYNQRKKWNGLFLPVETFERENGERRETCCVRSQSRQPTSVGTG